MPIIKSAKKRVRVTARATERNRITKEKLKSAVKSFTKALSGKSASKELAAAQSAVATAGKKHIMHKNKVARKQRQLAAAAKKAGVSVVGSGKVKAPKSAPAKKAPAAKAAPKKATVAKPAVKKAPAKTPAKKAAPKKK